MGYLEEYEWILLNEIAYNISFIYKFEDMKNEILIWLKSLIGFDGALITKVQEKSEDKEDWRKELYFVKTTSSGIDERTMGVWEEETSKNLWLIFSGRNSAFIDNDRFSEQKWEEQRIFQEFYQPNGFYYSMSMVFTFKEETMGMIQLFRTKESGSFTRRDLFALDQLQKHFAYRFSYEVKKGDTRYFFAKGYYEEIVKEYNLTEREGDVFIQVIQGYSNGEIAERGNVSIHTIKKHLQNIYAKMGVKNRVQLLQCLPLSSEKIDYDKL